MSWQPHITVATVVERDGKFLFVEEFKAGQHVFNQPAGHLEANETLAQAALRETLEETAWDVELTGVVGIYLYTAPSNGVTYQRICFAARPAPPPRPRTGQRHRPRRLAEPRRTTGRPGTLAQRAGAALPG